MGDSANGFAWGRSARVTPELVHELAEHPDARFGHCVIDAGAAAAHRPVALELKQAGMGCLGQKPFGQGLRGERERNIHPRAAGG